jgi:hypothetical protein
MNMIIKNLKSASGAMLGITLLLVATFFVLNFIQSKAPAPISTGGGWLFSHATGAAYQPAAPAMSTSAYSQNNNLGPNL